MAFAVSSPTSSLLQSSSTSSSGGRASSLGCISNSTISIPRNAVLLNIQCIRPLGFTSFAQWDGLKQLSTSISQYATKIERRGKLKGKGVYASLFGVGAPEVLVIGVVALLVFGPKGLAEVARNMGKTIRAFQPTIKELKEVSREFKSTLEREIGLDDDENTVPKSSSSSTTKPPATDSTTDTEPEDPADAQVKAQANWLRGALDQLQQEQAEDRQKKDSENTQSEADSQTPPQDTPEASDTAQEASPVMPPAENQDHNDNPLQETASAAPKDSPTPKAEAEV